MAEEDEAAIAQLLSSDEPAVRALVRRELPDEQVAPTAGGPRVDRLLGHPTDGHPYRKRTGVHWRPISLAELGVYPDLERVRELTDLTLSWLSRSDYPKDQRLPRRHASIEGSALAACCRLGRRDDPRAARLAELRVEHRPYKSGDPRGQPTRDRYPLSTAHRYGLNVAVAGSLVLCRLAGLILRNQPCGTDSDLALFGSGNDG